MASVSRTGAAAPSLDLDDLDLSPEQEAEVNEAFEAAVGEEPLQAKYKLELYFLEKRSVQKPFGGFLFAWTNGGFAHGGGDESVYFCPTELEPGKQCLHPIHIQFISKRFAVCESCRQAHEPKQLIGQVYAKLSFQNWATLITKYFRLLGSSADIRLGMMPGDLHSATKRELDKVYHGDLLNEIRRNRQWVIYELDRIIRDTTAGADLERRIRVFLSA